MTVLYFSVIWVLNLDDRLKYPMSNNRDHLVRRLTYLGPSVGVEAGKRNKAASLDHGLRGGTHRCRAHRRLRAAVAQVVLVVRKLLLVEDTTFNTIIAFRHLISTFHYLII